MEGTAIQTRQTRRWLFFPALLLVSFHLSAQEIVKTLSGSPEQSGTNNGPVAQALFSDPAGLAVDQWGNIYIADSQNHTIRKISTNGVVSTLAGLAGQPGNQDGTGSEARFDGPTGIAVDGNGALFVTDTGNHTIRRLTANGVVTTLAGFAGEPGYTNGPPNLARFNSPSGIVVDADETIFVADTGNHTIRRITNGVVSTLAGAPELWGSDDGIGEFVRFNGPVGLALGPAGTLFVSDANNFTIRRITPNGVVTTFAGVAGSDGCVDGPAASARFCKPAELMMDTAENLYVADSYNHVIRKISYAGNVTTIAGRAGNYGATDGANGEARFYNPYGLSFDWLGNLIVSDTYNQTIRSLFLPFEVTSGPSGEGGVRIIWNSVNGKNYQVQFKDDLNDPAWHDLGNVEAGNSYFGSAVLDPNPPAKQRFYRVKVVNP